MNLSFAEKAILCQQDRFPDDQVQKSAIFQFGACAKPKIWTSSFCLTTRSERFFVPLSFPFPGPFTLGTFCITYSAF